jgi:transglutaminase-like putative cysteine protease
VTDSPRRHVSAHLEVAVEQSLDAVLKVAVCDQPGLLIDERLAIALDGEPLTPDELSLPGEGRAHLLTARPGLLTVDYQATIDGRAAPQAATRADYVVYARPSRYAESDRLEAIARDEFGGLRPGPALLGTVSAWVNAKLGYVPGSSAPTDGAVQTLLRREGVCRDYAHLVVALLRALDVPARVAAVYAPGLQPPDFHAVAEAIVDGCWRVTDATPLTAPRAGLVRIATGRDAADVAFRSTYGGACALTRIAVTASADGELPADDAAKLASIG